MGLTGGSGVSKWFGGVLSPFGEIVGIPYNSASVLIIDPLAKIADTSSIVGLGLQLTGKAGGVLSPSGKLFGIPFSSESVLHI